MKKLRRLLVMVLALPCAAHADPFNDFKARVTSTDLKPFALDIGGILGAASFSDGRALGFPGFRLDVLGVVQSRPDQADAIMHDAGLKAFGVPMLEAAVGLPAKIDAVVHGLEVNHVSIVGGGLRYGIFKSGLLTKFLPNVGVGFFGDKANHSAFKATHFGANLSASWSLPIVTPFIGAGYDTTKVVVGDANNPSLTAAQNAALISAHTSASGSRFMAGVDLTPFPFARIHAAYVLLHGISGGNFGLGLQF